MQPLPRLWTQKETAAHLGVSERYLRSSTAPKLLLPGTGPRRRPLVRYEPRAVEAWYRAFTSGAGEAA